MTEKMPIEKKKCMTPEFRVSFPQVFNPKAMNAKSEPKFSITMLFNKNTDLANLKRAVFNAANEKYGSKEKWPKNLKLPFRDGDNERGDKPGYENTIFVSASSKQRPGVIDREKNEIMEQDGTFYAGCYARATLIAFAYEQMGNIGVSFALQNIQKLRDGEQFSGKRKAQDEFDTVEDDSSNSDNYDEDMFS